MRFVYKTLYFIALVFGTLLLYTEWPFRNEIPRSKVLRKEIPNAIPLIRSDDNGFRELNLQASHLVIQTNITNRLLEEHRMIQKKTEVVTEYHQEGTKYRMQLLQGGAKYKELKSSGNETKGLRSINDISVNAISPNSDNLKDQSEHNMVKNPSKNTIRLNVDNDLQLILKGNTLDNVPWSEKQDILKKNSKLFINNPVTSLFGTHSMNATKSRSIDFDRSIMDTRTKTCISKYGDNYARTASWKYRRVSIVIPYHNEEYSIFLRGLHSIYNRTPNDLLHEIILVDDSSTFKNLKEPFETYVKHLPKLQLYRTYKRQGLIRSRLLGAMMSTGDVLVFLDAHIECQSTWLEPLLDVINTIPTGIAIPTVDLIDSKSIQYRLWSRRQYGTFSWELDFVWKDIPWNDLPQDATAPIKSATMIGCSLAMARDNFFRMGAYDEDMFIWGGENLELSFRTWMCGGGLHIAPCSHVGHLFRAYLPYHFPTGDSIINKNLQRVAETWMGNYKKYYYSTIGKVVKFNQNEKESLKSRIHFIRSTLACKSFGWYLREIANGVDVPVKDSVLFGQLKNLGSYSCFIYSENNLGMEQCTLLNSNQTFYMDTTGHLVHLLSKLCIGLNLRTSKTVSMSKCQPGASHQKWLFDPLATKYVKQKLSGVDTRRPMGSLRLQFGGYQLCLMSGTVVRNCGGSKRHTQYWIFTHKINNNRITSIFDGS